MSSLLSCVSHQRSRCGTRVAAAVVGGGFWQACRQVSAGLVNKAAWVSVAGLFVERFCRSSIHVCCSGLCNDIVRQGHGSVQHTRRVTCSSGSGSKLVLMPPAFLLAVWTVVAGYGHCRCWLLLFLNCCWAQRDTTTSLVSPAACALHTSVGFATAVATSALWDLASAAWWCSADVAGALVRVRVHHLNTPVCTMSL